MLPPWPAAPHGGLRGRCGARGAVAHLAAELGDFAGRPRTDVRAPSAARPLRQSPSSDGMNAAACPLRCDAARRWCGTISRTRLRVWQRAPNPQGGQCSRVNRVEPGASDGATRPFADTVARRPAFRHPATHRPRDLLSRLKGPGSPPDEPARLPIPPAGGGLRPPRTSVPLQLPEVAAFPGMHIGPPIVHCTK